jgi:hypothetical protein
MDRDMRLIAELSPMGAVAMGAVGVTVAHTVPAMVQSLMSDLIMVTGRSMLPTFPKRCICKVTHKPFAQLQINDVPAVHPVDEDFKKWEKQLQNTDKDYRDLTDSINLFLRRPMTPITGYVHRIIQSTPQGFVTKGDGNASRDAHVATAANYEGYVVSKVMLDVSGAITGTVLQGLYTLLKNYKPVF